jgi:hypothetical protein
VREVGEIRKSERVSNMGQFKLREYPISSFSACHSVEQTTYTDTPSLALSFVYYTFATQQSSTDPGEKQPAIP